MDAYVPELFDKGISKGPPKETDLTWISCDVDGCEYHVRVLKKTEEANLRQHKEKSCPLKPTEATESAPDVSPLSHQGISSYSPPTTLKDFKTTHSWEALRKALREEESRRIPIYNGVVEGKVRNFDTGATRDTDEGKLDYEGFLSPLVLERYAQYMHEHRFQSDGQLRDSDNWQKGMPLDEYMKSDWRHQMEWWMGHRAWSQVDIEDAICGVLFNAMGYLHELLKEQRD